MLPPLAYELSATLLGLLLGSFLNVCIVRLPAHRSLSRPRSHCPLCQAAIPWYDNLPLLSWLLLRARCRHCGQRISWRYPVVELATALWFLVVAAKLVQLLQLNAAYQIARLPGTLDGTVTGGLSTTQWVNGITFLVGLALLGFLLIGLAVMDWRTHTLPDAFTLPGILAGFVLIFLRAAFLAPGELDIHFDPQRAARLSSPGSFIAKGDVFLTGPEHLVLGRVLAVVCAGCLLLLVRIAYRRLRGRDGLGLGDAKLLAMIAAFLGFWPAMLALLLGVVLCSAYALLLLARGRAGGWTRLPLGSFLALGGLAAALFGARIIAWYTTLL